MTAPITPGQIVQDMIVRLRELQGTGEYVPLTQQVIAGAGLAGGGPLSSNVTLSLNAASTAAIDRLVSATWVTSAAPTVTPTANRIALRSSTGTVRTGTPLDATDTVPKSYSDAQVVGMVKQVTGQTPIQVSVVSESSHVQANEVPGVLYIITEG